MSSDGPLLVVEQVAKTYQIPGRQEDGLSVLRSISLDVKRGGSVAIIGPSGSGKSTLLQIIGTLDRPTSGSVTLNGKRLDQLSEQQLAQVRNEDIGFVFQSHHLLPQCTVLENVLVPTLPRCKRSAENTGEKETEPSRARRLLERVGLGDRLAHRPGELSGGERQRVAVVRALINKPRLLLADEPTGSLDHASAIALGRLLAELNKEEQVALIVVTHALDLARQMDRRFELRDGMLATWEG